MDSRRGDTLLKQGANQRPRFFMAISAQLFTAWPQPSFGGRYTRNPQPFAPSNFVVCRLLSG